MSRTVTVVSTRSNTKKFITSDAQKWGQLKEDLRREGIEYNDMTVLEKESYTSLEHNDAALPTGEFTIYIMPKKMKSGFEVNVESLRALKTRIGEIKSEVEGLASPAVREFIIRGEELLESIVSYEQAVDHLLNEETVAGDVDLQTARTISVGM